MKISICIPQYNRIAYLLKSLSLIEQQSYADIEVVISDDASTDDTKTQIEILKLKFKYPIVLHSFKENVGYDKNYRKTIELATGDYCFILGNDDTLNGSNAIGDLVVFLNENNLPDIGFCNYVEESSINVITKRAQFTKLLGSGPEVALKYYSCFSFVAGIIYKRSFFNKFNTAEFDKSIYAQIALGVSMIVNGAKLFSIKEPIVLKDLLIDSKKSNSYRDSLNRSWKNFSTVNGGLPQVIQVLFSVFEKNGFLSNKYKTSIYRKIYTTTFPFWILDYKSNGAFPHAFGLFLGLAPWKYQTFSKLNWILKMEVVLTWLLFGIGSLVFPVIVFQRFKNTVYSKIKE
jgi:glycosyltransferase involved in cell wall biosynthesis